MAAKKKTESTRVQRLERKRAQSREEILEATKRVILRDGNGATLDAIAAEVGLTKAALYYYYPSKDALLFEIMFQILMSEATATRDSVEATDNGGDALAALIRSTVTRYAPRLDDFRLAFLHGQVSPPEAKELLPSFFQRIRPLNDFIYGTTSRKLEATGKETRSGVPPRRLAFLAHMAAIGLLTMKGMVESVGDPLIYSDEQLIDDLAKIFRAAAAPPDAEKTKVSGRRRST